MTQFYFHFVFVSQMSCQRISGINASVLSAGAAKVYRQIGKAPFDIFFHRNINKVKHTIEKSLHFGLTFEEFHYRFISAVIFFVFSIAARVFYSPAVKNKTATITAGIVGNSFPVRKAANLYN